MKKILLGFSLSLFFTASSRAQIAAVIPELPLPAVGGAVVIQPVNAGSSTLQQIPVAALGGALHNFYVHTWDAGPAGIAWRRTDAGGSLVSDGFLPLAAGTLDADVALFRHVDGLVYALVGYHQTSGPSGSGYYYDLYRFSPLGGLTPFLLSQFLMATSTPAGINVDANSEGMGLAISWCIPGTGIYVKVAPLNAAFSGNLLISGTATFRYPDIAISRYGSGMNITFAARNAAETQVRVWELPWSSAMSVSLAGLSLAYTSPSYSGMNVPRIDCPDNFGDQKWTTVFAAYNVVSGTTTERIFAAVKNTSFSSMATLLTLRTGVYTGGYLTNNPVIAYNNAANRIHVGWITADTTTAIPPVGPPKYVAQYVSDPGGIAPTSLASSYMMISNTFTNNVRPVLAFSGQNTMSNFNGLHTAYSQFSTFFFGQYTMVYKDKPWSSGTFRLGTEEASTLPLSVYPNPFSNSLSLRVPLKGLYQLRLLGIDGKVMYQEQVQLEAQQQLDIPTAAFAPGIYFLHASCPENNWTATQKLVK